MDAVKQAAIEAIKRLPDSCSPEDIMYQVYFISQVIEGLKDADEKRVIRSDELLREIERWLRSGGQNERS